MPQAQNIVAVELKGGAKSKAIATGNNAAWICVCGRAEPLLGSGTARIDCPKCHRRYLVVPRLDDRGAVGKVVEIE
jgi:DNA-directed RNA polymerase subunit RPC12/RpoP